MVYEAWGTEFAMHHQKKILTLIFFIITSPTFESSLILTLSYHITPNLIYLRDSGSRWSLINSISGKRKRGPCMLKNRQPHRRSQLLEQIDQTQ